MWQYSFIINDVMSRRCMWQYSFIINDVISVDVCDNIALLLTM